MEGPFCIPYFAFAMLGRAQNHFEADEREAAAAMSHRFLNALGAARGVAGPRGAGCPRAR